MVERSAAVMVFAATTALLASPVIGQSQQNIEGTYCLTGIREVGSCFRFSADRRFEYYLSYGAYDEASVGRWRLESGDIVLESPPYDRQPRFTFKEQRSADVDTFKIVVVNSAGRGLAGIDVRVSCGPERDEGYTQQDGYETPCTSSPNQVELGVRMVGMAFQVVPTTGSGSDKALVFEFDPGDLGKKAFVGTRLRRERTGLSLIYRSTNVGDLDGRPFIYRKN